MIDSKKFPVTSGVRFFRANGNVFIPMIRSVFFTNEGDVDLVIPIKFMDEIEKIPLGSDLLAVACPCVDIKVYNPEGQLIAFETLQERETYFSLDLIDNPELILATYRLKFEKIWISTVSGVTNIVRGKTDETNPAQPSKSESEKGRFSL